MPPPPRAIATVLAEIAEVRRHLHDAPPHHGGGSGALEARLAQLEAELVGLRSVAASSAPREPGTAAEAPDRGHQGDASRQP